MSPNLERVVYDSQPDGGFKQADTIARTSTILHEKVDQLDTVVPCIGSKCFHTVYMYVYNVSYRFELFLMIT